MKKLLMLFLSLMMILALFGCGSKEGGNDGNKKEETSLPDGIWVLKYIGDQDGEYVEEFNMIEDFYGNPINLLEMATVDYGEITYIQLDENAEGTYYPMRGEPKEISFTEDKVTIDGIEKEYRRNGNRLWFPEDDPVFNEVYESVSLEMLEKIKRGAYDCVDFDKAQIGDMVAMGEYEMSPGNDRTEPIKWRVIDRKDDRLFIICDKLIDSFCFNTNPNQEDLDSVSWENCSVRAFLNDPEGFLSCFTEEEIDMIEITRNQNKAANEQLLKYWGGFHDEGNAAYSQMADQHRSDDPQTDDRVFLLSFEEVEGYFGEASEPSDDPSYPYSEMPKNSQWIAYVTKAVQDNGTGFYDSRTLGGAWMTRTLSTADPKWGNQVTYISADGQVFNYFTYVPLFIRPAMWIKIK